MKNMHSVSDDDFDKLFREKLYSYEAEPTDAVWAGISEQLSTAQKGRNFPILRIAAASMVAVVGFGMWLAATKEPMKLSGTTDSILVKPKQEIVKVPEKPKDEVVKVTPVQVAEGGPEIPQPKTITVAESKTKVIPVPSSSRVTVARKVDAGEDKGSVTVKQEQENAVSTDLAFNETPTLALSASSESEMEPVQPQLKLKKIKSVGSLVNFVVSKVDKRKDKIIEFEDNDEGTKVSGLNLGVVKFKAKDE